MSEVVVEPGVGVNPKPVHLHLPGEAPGVCTCWVGWPVPAAYAVSVYGSRIREPYQSHRITWAKPQAAWSPEKWDDRLLRGWLLRGA